jgi:predicted SAM-dependent methyltransferase
LISRRRLEYVATTGLRRRVRDALVPAEDRFVRREDVARRYLRGEGIEIGPFVWPLRMPAGAHARMVDRSTRDQLIAAHRDTVVNIEAVPAIDVIDDGEELRSFADGALDFVVASHVLEHIEDPVGALATWLRVLRSGGILLIVMPDAAQGFDGRRERTSVEHVMRDHREGPAWSRSGHYEEWARLIEGRADEQVAARVAEFEREGARHHFHVWELGGFLELIGALGGCAVEYAERSVEEFIVVVRKA